MNHTAFQPASCPNNDLPSIYLAVIEVVKTLIPVRHPISHMLENPCTENKPKL